MHAERGEGSVHCVFARRCSVLESFQVYAKGVAMFGQSHVTPLWSARARFVRAQCRLSRTLLDLEPCDEQGFGAVGAEDEDADELPLYGLMWFPSW